MEKSPPLAPELVSEFVRKAHSDIDGVRELLEIEPKLVNASWDWGDGDFESGLGAAAHTGRREIALLLIERGARLDIFAAAMLGMLDVVKTALTACPDARKSLGAHGIPLIVHAKMGGEPAREVYEFLESLA
ncbi:ankyrin repeat-containing protein [Hyphomicrobium denitrificans ATCC 51888]|uniref:Ankyrin repeat-containing protein n=1 Tax=Hyphomicrobium denitrificans (strain ATCC 51888 / DSM 1869 / NCIMB 11706 / TK 0415) TaxID=582899 RepID=D8JYF4_HYPDA|nr:hypothetical protein [Hyphomicrobium denitrificans]ADJ23406.1 ankyrin repeat-containing protein [Hyphomicrobium denitrificans ATCC 51888]